MIDQKQKILDFFSDLTFNEGDHIYHVGKHRVKESVSNLVKAFEIPFDSAGISKRVAESRGMTQDEVLEMWSKNSRKALDKGNEGHLFGETYMFDRSMEPKTGVEKAIVSFWNDLPDYIVPVIAELKMYHKEYLFAGTADIILYNTITEKYIICDYKTNKDLFKNFKKQRMLGLFNNLLDMPFNKYQLQLSFYQILFEQLGLEVSSRKIIWLLDDGTYKLYGTEDYKNILEEFLKVRYEGK